jgi:hypothetical protein
VEKASLILSCVFLTFFTAHAGEWPVFKPATVVATEDPSNISDAELNEIRIYVNDKVELISESWTLSVRF